MTGLDHQAERLKAARNRKSWSQSRLAASMEEVARRLSKLGDLPPGGRRTLIQVHSYFENGKRAVPERLRPIFCEVFQASNEDLGLTAATPIPLGLVRLPELPAEHLPVFWADSNVVTQDGAGGYSPGRRPDRTFILDSRYPSATSSHRTNLPHDSE